MPRVSIGMPIYNGERYLAGAMDSLIAQTFTDFEIIISDNASTDRTQEICQSYVKKDQRIRYHRNEANIGANPNFNHVFGLASAPYFMWHAHDDLRASDFLAEAVNVLDSNPEVVIAFSHTAVIDETGSVVIEDVGERLRVDSPEPHIRFHDLQRTTHWCFPMLGLFRASALASTAGLRTFSSADYPLLGELGLMGPFHEIPRTLTFYRRHPGQSIELDRHQRMAWSGSGASIKTLLPQWRLFFSLWVCTQRVPLPIGERLLCYGTILCWPLWYRNWRRLGKDLILALAFMLKRVRPLPTALR